jgi:hypothetical protein
MKHQNNPWPWAIIMTFVLFISGTIGLVVMASSQREDLVSANYYEQELRFQSQLDRASHANHLSAPASVAYDALRRHVVITLPPEHAGRVVNGRVQLYRPSEAELDRQFKLVPDATGCQTIDAASLRPGLWKARITWTVDGNEFYTERQLVIGPQK